MLMGVSAHLVFFGFLGATGDAVQQVSGVLSTTADGIFVEEVGVGCRDPQPCVFANDERGAYLLLAAASQLNQRCPS